MHGPSRRGKLLLFALALTLVSSMLVLFLPLIVAQTFYYSRDTILLLIPAKNFMLLAVALGMLVVMLVIIAFLQKPWSYTLATIVVLLSGITGYASTQSIILIEQQGITIRDVYKKEHYTWDSIARVTYYYTAHTDNGKYTFVTTTGEEITINETPLFDAYKKSVFREVLKRHNISYETHSR